jgi:hypothetical protein
MPSLGFSSIDDRHVVSSTSSSRCAANWSLHQWKHYPSPRHSHLALLGDVSARRVIGDRRPRANAGRLAEYDFFDDL